MTRLEGESSVHASNNNSTLNHPEDLSQSVWRDMQCIPRHQSTNESFPKTYMSAQDPLTAGIRSDFKNIDKNGDGLITIPELDNAIANGKYKGSDAVLPVALKYLSNPELRKASGGALDPDPKAGFTQEQLLSLYGSQNSNVRNLFASVSDAASQRVQQVEKQGSRPYATTPEGSIRPETVHQGSTGDCAFLAALSSLSNTPNGKRQIQNMITDNQNGTYSVKFPGADKSLTVDAPTESELALYANGGDKGIWPNVLEKAYGKYINNQEHYFPSLMGTTVQAQALDNGSTDLRQQLRVLTNGEAESVHLRQWSDDGSITPANVKDVVRLLSESNVDGHCVIASVSNPHNSLGLPSGHAYSILKYDAKNNEITVRNPWGTGEPKDASGKPLDGSDDGIFKISLERFRANFATLESSKIPEVK